MTEMSPNTGVRQASRISRVSGLSNHSICINLCTHCSLLTGLRGHQHATCYISDSTSPSIHSSTHYFIHFPFIHTGCRRIELSIATNCDTCAVRVWTYTLKSRMWRPCTTITLSSAALAWRWLQCGARILKRIPNFNKTKWMTGCRGDALCCVDWRMAGVNWIMLMHACRVCC